MPFFLDGQHQPGLAHRLVGVPASGGPGRAGCGSRAAARARGRWPRRRPRATSSGRSSAVNKRARSMGPSVEVLATLSISRVKATACVKSPRAPPCRTRPGGMRRRRDSGRGIRGPGTQPDPRAAAAGPPAPETPPRPPGATPPAPRPRPGSTRQGTPCGARLRAARRVRIAAARRSFSTSTRRNGPLGSSLALDSTNARASASPRRRPGRRIGPGPAPGPPDGSSARRRGPSGLARARRWRAASRFRRRPASGRRRPEASSSGFGRQLDAPCGGSSRPDRAACPGAGYSARVTTAAGFVGSSFST